MNQSIGTSISARASLAAPGAQRAQFPAVGRKRRPNHCGTERRQFGGTSVRRIHFAMAGGYPNQVEFEMAHLYLRRAFSSP